MLPGGLVGGIGWLGGALCQITLATSVELTDHNVRIRDVATLGCVQPNQRQAIGGLVIARLDRNTSEIEISAKAIANLVRRRAPGLTDLTANESPRKLRFRAQAPGEPAPLRESPCFKASRVISGGQALTSASLAPAECMAAPAKVLRYDRPAGVLRATTDIPRGAYLGRLAAPPRNSVGAGDTVSVAITRGSVRIARDVRTLQPASGGDRAFVRDEEGNVFAAPIVRDDLGAVK